MVKDNIADLCFLSILPSTLLFSMHLVILSCASFDLFFVFSVILLLVLFTHCASR